MIKQYSYANEKKRERIKKNNNLKKNNKRVENYGKSCSNSGKSKS